MRQQTYRREPDDSPLATLYLQHAPTIFAYLRLHAASREDAEDILLEVFLEALEYGSLAERSENTQRAWLRSVAHHKMVDRYRQVTRHRSVALEHVAETLYEDEALSPEQKALQQEEYEQVSMTVKRLPVLQQEVVRLRFVHGLRCSEIAAVLDKNEGAVRKLLSRALNLLRAIYTEGRP